MKKPKATLAEAFRQLLIKLCSDPKTRIVPNSPESPCRWFPWCVIDPRSGEPFTDAGAWDFIVEVLDSKCPMEIMELDKPTGDYAFVLKVSGGISQQNIYIKLHPKRQMVQGRSFHY